MTEIQKFCMCCEESKCVSMFYKNKHKNDGLQGYCKSCMKIENQNNYVKHKDTWDLRTLQYNKTEKNKKYRREWCKNKYKTNEEYRKQCIKYSVEYEKLMLKSNIEFKLKHNLRSRLRDAIKACKGNKYRTTMELTGCDISFLKPYLEGKFAEFSLLYFNIVLIVNVQFTYVSKREMFTCFDRESESSAS